MERNEVQIPVVKSIPGVSIEQMISWILDEKRNF